MGDVLIRHAGYDEDFFLWTQEQAQALRAMQHNESNVRLDWENIAEEIESLGKSDRRGCTSFVGQILAHLLKLKYWPDAGPKRGWQKEIRTFRFQLEQIIDDSPSLRAKMPEVAASEQTRVLKRLMADFEDHPEFLLHLKQAAIAFPFTHEQVLDDSFYPG